MPLKQRVPKLKGFNNPFRVEYQAGQPRQLGACEQYGTVDPDVLVDHGLVRKGAFVKVLARGEITRSRRPRACRSKAAEAAIAAAGGSVTLLPLPFNEQGRPPVKGNQFTNR